MEAVCSWWSIPQFRDHSSFLCCLKDYMDSRDSFVKAVRNSLQDIEFHVMVSIHWALFLKLHTLIFGRPLFHSIFALSTINNRIL